MFATLSPWDKAQQDNLHTLQLAVMAKNIKNKVKLNLVSRAVSKVVWGRGLMIIMPYFQCS